MKLTTDQPLARAVVAAIQNGAIEELRALLEEQPELATATIVDANGVGRTLLHIATDWPGHFPNVGATVTTLIAAGADPNVATPETPLHWAASSDDVAAIDALLDGGANIEAPGAVFTGGTPMSDAVVFAQWNAARRLLERGARTTLWQSAALGLLDRMGDAPRDEVTNAFWNACRGGQPDAARHLLERGADVNWIGHDHKTPLDVAEERGAAELVAWLRARGAKKASER